MRLLRAAGWLTLLAAVLVYAAHWILHVGPEWVHPRVSQGVIVAAAAICITRGVVGRGERAPWLVIGSGMVLWAAGDIYYGAFVENAAAPPYPSPADVGWLSYYPSMYIGLMLLLRLRGANFNRSLWLDGAIAGVAVAAVTTAVVIGPVYAASEGSTFGAVATTLAYPLADCALLAIVIAAFGLMGWRPGARFLLLGAGFALSAIGDSLYAYMVAHGAAQADWIWIAYPASALSIAFAAWRSGGSTTIDLVRNRMLVVPTVFTVVSVGVLVYDHYQRVSFLSMALATLALMLAVVRFVATFGENIQLLIKARHDAHTDSLTGLSNRRQLVADLERRCASANDEPLVLGLYDLDGFKNYNDNFGHPAGDQLLVRLSAKLSRTICDGATAYRMGGDEFCVLAPAASSAMLEDAVASMAERGDAFDVTCSLGTVRIPEEASTPSNALSIADRRLYNRKGLRHDSSRSQARDVLVQALRERHLEVHDHSNLVADLSAATGRRLGLDPDRLDELAQAAELHDIGKVAIPDAILNKPGPLADDEWMFMHRHTLIGESIVGVAPSLLRVARIVRSSHERWDGGGYPDGLKGEQIPLAARIVFAADAYNAMTTDRTYQMGMSHENAVEELRRSSGSQFDPTVVDALLDELGAQVLPRGRSSLPLVPAAA
jgi:diguanylate cyclase (GGDEF)-like protein